jgi:hypothetical protein
MKTIYEEDLFWGMLIMALVFGLLYTACPTSSDDDDSNNDNSGDNAADITGTWEASGGLVIVFTGNTFDYKLKGTPQYSGTFSTAGSTITFKESRLGTASGNFELSAGKLVLSNHTWDSSVDGTYTKRSTGPGDNSTPGNTDNSTGNRTITITGLSGYSGDVMLYISSGGYAQDIVAQGEGTISNGSVTIHLKQFINHEISEADWTGTGQYFIYFGEVNEGPYSWTVFLYRG